MSSSQRIWKVIKPHLPLIRFKKGGNLKTSDAISKSSQSSSSGPPIGSTSRGSGIDEEFMPKRYHRKPLTVQEMEMIERGGAL